MKIRIGTYYYTRYVGTYELLGKYLDIIYKYYVSERKHLSENSQTYLPQFAKGVAILTFWSKYNINQLNNNWIKKVSYLSKKSYKNWRFIATFDIIIPWSIQL